MIRLVACAFVHERMPLRDHQHDMAQVTAAQDHAPCAVALLGKHFRGFVDDNQAGTRFPKRRLERIKTGADNRAGPSVDIAPALGRGRVMDDNAFPSL